MKNFSHSGIKDISALLQKACYEEQESTLKNQGINFDSENQR